MSFSVINKGASGLQAFSKGLDNVSNNVANLNTPGFKKSSTLFRDLFYRYQVTGDTGQEQSTSQIGTGVTTKGTLINFGQGDIQETGGDTDIAVNGNGFFILRNGDTRFYTRVGQFTFNEDNKLYSPNLDALVAGLDDDGNLVDIDITNLRNLTHEPTTEIRFIDNISLNAETHEIEDVEVVDSLGRIQELKFIFNKNDIDESPRSWLIVVENDEGEVIARDLEVRFDDRGLPEEGFNTVSFAFQPEDAASIDIVLNMGDPGSRSNSTASGGPTNLSVDRTDGFQTGALLNINFQSDGTIELEYSNEEKRDAGKVALAWFDQLQDLRQLGDGLYLAPENIDLTIAAPTDAVMGELVDNSIEISNIELSQEFTELIILQRGFQGASQTVTVANELIQQLIQLGRQT